MPDGENQIRSNEQIAFATIGIVAHAASRKHPWPSISSQAANRGNISFPQVKYPYNSKIVRGFFKDTPICTSVSTSQKRLQRSLLSRLPLLGRKGERGDEALRAADHPPTLSRRRREALGVDAAFEQVCAWLATMR